SSHQAGSSKADQETLTRFESHLSRISGPACRKALPDLRARSRFFHEQRNRIDRRLLEVCASLRAAEIPRAVARSVFPRPHFPRSVGNRPETVSRAIGSSPAR